MNNHQTRYIIDSNCFIEASRRYYSMEIAKPFWDALCSFARQGKLLSVDKVLEELKMGNDSLKQWAEVTFRPHFQNTQINGTLQTYITLMLWAESQTQYNRIAKDRFMEDSNADTWILAYAKTYNCKIVTQEVPSIHVKRNIPIPNVCDAFGIEYCDTFQMLKELNFSF